MINDTWDMHQVVDALDTIQNAERWLKARAKSAGLDCFIHIDGWAGKGDKIRMAIRLSAGVAAFKTGANMRLRSRAVSHASAYNLEEFDRIVAAAVAYRKGRK